MKRLLFQILFLTCFCSTFGQSEKVFEPDSNIKKYYKGVTPSYTRLAINVDLLNYFISKQSSVGLVYSITNRLGAELFYTFPIGDQKPIRPHYIDDKYSYPYSTTFSNSFGINGFVKVGTLGLTNTVYTGIGYKKSTFESIYGGNSTGKIINSYGTEIYWVLGSMAKFFKAFQVNWMIGLGSRKLKGVADLPDGQILANKNSGMFLAQVKLQYLIF